MVGALQLDMTNYQGSEKDIWLMKDFTSAPQNAFLIKLIDTYVGATWGDDANTFKVGSSTVLDALLAYTRDNWRLSLNVTNLADTRYVAACYSLAGCFYAEGRKAIGKVTYRW